MKCSLLLCLSFRQPYIRAGHVAMLYGLVYKSQLTWWACEIHHWLKLEIQWIFSNMSENMPETSHDAFQVPPHMDRRLKWIMVFIKNHALSDAPGESAWCQFVRSTNIREYYYWTVVRNELMYMEHVRTRPSSRARGVQFTRGNLNSFTKFKYD